MHRCIQSLISFRHQLDLAAAETSLFLDYAVTNSLWSLEDITATVELLYLPYQFKRLVVDFTWQRKVKILLQPLPVP